jgi:hypothetical protein
VKLPLPLLGFFRYGVGLAKILYSWRAVLVESSAFLFWCFLNMIYAAVVSAGLVGILWADIPVVAPENQWMVLLWGAITLVLFGLAVFLVPVLFRQARADLRAHEALHPGYMRWDRRLFFFNRGLHWKDRLGRRLVLLLTSPVTGFLVMVPLRFLRIGCLWILKVVGQFVWQLGLPCEEGAALFVVIIMSLMGILALGGLVICRGTQGTRTVLKSGFQALCIDMPKGLFWLILALGKLPGHVKVQSGALVEEELCRKKAMEARAALSEAIPQGAPSTPRRRL